MVSSNKLLSALMQLHTHAGCVCEHDDTPDAHRSVIRHAHLQLHAHTNIPAHADRALETSQGAVAEVSEADETLHSSLEGGPTVDGSAEGKSEAQGHDGEAGSSPEAQPSAEEGSDVVDVAHEEVSAHMV